MTSPSPDRPRDPTPFLLKLFYRIGTFHRPDEFTTPTSLPPHLNLHIYPTTTLLELSHLLASALPSALPSPAVGTRLSFRLIYPDASYVSRPPPPTSSDAAHLLLPQRFLAKDLGSLVLGEGGPGVGTDLEGDGGEGDVAMMDGKGKEEKSSAAGKTLAEAKFVVGDYLSVAVLPPDEGTGAVVPAAGRVEVGRGPGGVVSALVRNGAGPHGVGRGGGGWGRGGGGGGRFGGGREWDAGRGGRDRDGVRFPEGEWRRGERLPDGGSGGGGRGRRW
ncbi:Sin3 associated polypeptide p18-domain-containing protein [Coniochaeta sp. 2T2.1]|nr:Sin3 associated polypeptide p18-domain-containing protein [Coniochaeta sp. 2T2.1]